VSKLGFHNSGIGRTRGASVRASTDCHPELTAKDLCPGGEARAQRVLCSVERDPLSNLEHERPLPPLFPFVRPLRLLNAQAQWSTTFGVFPGAPY